MSLYKDASLVMIPSAYKDGKLYSIRPTDGDGDFTFSRGTTATRVDVNGLIEKGRENRLLQSNQFDTTWINALTGTITGGQSGYDGSSNAWLLDKGAVNGRIQQSIVSSGVQTYSVYAKAGTSNWMSLMITTATGDRVAFFDLANGTTGFGYQLIDKNIESVGNGWYRCSITLNETSITARIYVSDSNNNNSGTSGSIYIQDAQLEAGLVATDYIETGASTAQAGILEDMPRLDYSGSCPALLLEPQRTNLLNHGEYFGAWTLNAGGTGSAPVLEANTTDTLSPEGKYNAYKVTFDSGAGTTTSDESIMYRSKSGLTAGSNHTASVYLKGEAGGEEVIVRDTEGSYKKWTLTTEWARYDYTQVASASSYATSFGIRQGVVGTINSNAVVYMYGFQSELGSYPTSYIPTYGASVTRSYDVCKKTNIDSLIAEEGTAFIDVTNGDENEVNAFMTIADSSVYPDHIWIGQNGTTLSLYVKANDSYSLIANNIASVEGRKKIAVVYTNESIKVFVNGTNEYTANDKTLPSQLNRVELGAFNTSINTGTARYDQAVLFPTALTDSECIALTTI